MLAVHSDPLRGACGRDASSVLDSPGQGFPCRPRGGRAMVSGRSQWVAADSHIPLGIGAGRLTRSQIFSRSSNRSLYRTLLVTVADVRASRADRYRQL